MDPTTESFISKDVNHGLRVVQSLQVVLGFFGFGGNLLSIIILTRRSAKTQINFLLINQSLTDLIASALLIASTLSGIFEAPAPSTPISGYIYCILWNSNVLLWSFFAISTFNLTVISIERYFAVLHPIWYIAKFKRFTTFILAALCWVFGPVFNIAYNILTETYQEKNCMRSERSSAVNVLSVFLFFWEYFFPVCIMSFSFVAIARKFLRMNRVAAELNPTPTANTTGLPKPSEVTGASGSQLAFCHTQGSHSQKVSVRDKASGKSASRMLKMGITVRDVGSSNEPSRAESSRIELSCVEPGRGKTNEQGGGHNAVVIRRLKTTKVLLVVYLAYVICWSPNQWYFLQYNLGGSIDFEGIFHYITVIMATCNTCVNPVIYVITMASFKKELKSMFKRRQMN